MSFFSNKQSPMLPNQPPQQKQPREKKQITKEDKKLLWLLLGCSVASTLVYFTAVSDPLRYWLIASFAPEVAQVISGIFGIGTMVAFAVVAAVFLVVYILYNRGFTRDNVTPDMLPDTMSEHEKTAFIQDAVERKRKSKWMIIVIVALFCPLAIDFLILTAIPTLLGPVFGPYLGL
jgi:hypothetical protein